MLIHLWYPGLYSLLDSPLFWFISPHSCSLSVELWASEATMSSYPENDLGEKNGAMKTEREHVLDVENPARSTGHVQEQSHESNYHEAAGDGHAATDQ